MRFYVKTLGCKVNQVESAYVVERLKECGFEASRLEDEAEVFILNSCAVTEKAYQETKKILRHWAKLNPKAVIVTGCSAVIYGEELKTLAERLEIPHFLILGQNEKFELQRFVKNLEELPSRYLEISPLGETCYPVILKEFYEHSRAFVKIQDGCSSYCSYCIVPYARGPSRSLPEKYILEQVRIYLAQGYREIVLTGIHLGMWGEDLKPKRKLTHLLYLLEELFQEYRKPLHLRLSSLEATEIDEDFLEFAKKSKFLCPHFHLPLQSGSNEILSKMNRKYSAEEYLEKLNQLYELFPLATFGADVMVGFPGEEERHFLETYELIEKSPLNWLHVFSFSPRPNTKAFSMKNLPPKEEVRRRVSLLRELHQKKRKEFLAKNLGEVRSAILEKEKDGHFQALTNNYITVFIPKEALIMMKPLAKPKELIKVKLLEPCGEALRGFPINGTLVEKSFKGQKIMKA